MMPKFILATVALLFGRPFPLAAKAHDAMHAATRTRSATHHLRASRIHDPYVDLSPLDLSRRH